MHFLPRTKNMVGLMDAKNGIPDAWKMVGVLDSRYGLNGEQDDKVQKLMRYLEECLQEM